MPGCTMINEIDSEFSLFKKYYTDFLKSLGENDINTFRKFTCDEGRIKYVYNLPMAQNYKILTNKSFKSVETAKQFKESGNLAFQVKQYKKAAELYSKGIINQPQTTPSEKEQLSVLFANRSAALYHLHKYELALEDIQSAFEFNYPLQLQHKVCDRRARCFLALNQLISAKEAFRQTILALDVAKVSGDKRMKMQSDIQIMLAMLDKNKELTNASQKKAPSNRTPFKQGVNKQYPGASDSIVIKEEPEAGRFAEARTDIAPGELLLREMPHCAVLLDQYAGSHCFQCFVRVNAPKPCPDCNNVVFCSKACLAVAMETHHRFECSILPILWQSGASITCMMALRVITQQNLQFFLQLRSSLENSTKRNIYQSKDYLNIYHLINHSSKRTTEDFLHRTLMAIFLLRCLQTTDYFKLSNENSSLGSDKILPDNEKYIGGLILRHLQSLQFNSHEVSELLIEGKEKRSVFIGGAVYPTLALFNHSCNPGIVRYHQGTEVTVRAIRTIRGGELVAENYGPIFTQVRRKDRQQTLKTQYWFDCKCEACEGDWPILDEMTSNMMRFRCECGSTILVPVETLEFMVPCQSCNQYINILKGLKVLQDTDTMFRVAQSLVDEGSMTKALKKFIELLVLLDNTLVPPFRDYHLCQQQLRTCIMSCGNVFVKDSKV